MSLNIITVSLNMDTVNYLGISIVGQSNKGGDGGIYVGSIMKGLVYACECEWMSECVCVWGECVLVRLLTYVCIFIVFSYFH